ncbi:MAG: DUF3037 domain-containing protein [Bacteroidota bacterium]
MHNNHLYEYAVIRLVPFVEREEFLNVGIILFCKQQKFIKVLHAIDEKKLSLFSNTTDVEQIKQNLRAFTEIADGNSACQSPISKLDIPSRFRWLTAVRSSAIQTSRPHPGLCVDLEQTTQRLFEELVL